MMDKARRERRINLKDMTKKKYETGIKSWKMSEVRERKKYQENRNNGEVKEIMRKMRIM